MAIYSKELARKICERIANGDSLANICEGEDFPNEATVRRWNLQDKHGFSTEYRRAREDQGEFYAQRVLDVAEQVLIKEHAPDAARVAIDAFKWSAGKLNGKYSDKVVIEGNEAKPLTLLISPIDKLKQVLGKQAARIAGPKDDEQTD